METVVVILSVGADRVDEFEAGFREHELPVWQDLQARGLLVHATLSRMDISTTTGQGRHAIPRVRDLRERRGPPCP